MTATGASSRTVAVSSAGSATQYRQVPDASQDGQSAVPMRRSTVPQPAHTQQRLLPMHASHQDPRRGSLNAPMP